MVKRVKSFELVATVTGAVAVVGPLRDLGIVPRKSMVTSRVPRPQNIPAPGC
jgi:hypothetical protein